MSTVSKGPGLRATPSVALTVPERALLLAWPGRGPADRVVMAHWLTVLIPENCARWQETSWLLCWPLAKQCWAISVPGQEECEPGWDQRVTSRLSPSAWGPTAGPLLQEYTADIPCLSFCRLMPLKALLFLGIHHSQ